MVHAIVSVSRLPVPVVAHMRVLWRHRHCALAPQALCTCSSVSVAVMVVGIMTTGGRTPAGVHEALGCTPSSPALSFQPCTPHHGLPARLPSCLLCLPSPLPQRHLPPIRTTHPLPASHPPSLPPSLPPLPPPPSPFSQPRGRGRAGAARLPPPAAEGGPRAAADVGVPRRTDHPGDLLAALQARLRLPHRYRRARVQVSEGESVCR